MNLLAGERFFGSLALVAGIGAVLLVLVRLVPVGRPLVDAIRPLALWLAFTVAAVSMFGSLWFSESQHLVPCKLCWYQRIAMYSVAIVLLVGAIRRDRGVRWYAVPLAVVGLVVSTYHYLIEWHPEWEATKCDVTVPCSTPYFRAFGFVSLSFMALCGFAAVLSLLLTTAQRTTAPAEPAPAASPAETEPAGSAEG
jgi:disulfide bond formation protein DsbB